MSKQPPQDEFAEFAKETLFKAPIDFEKMSDFQKLGVGTVGKMIRIILNEDYLKCNCVVCKQLQKLHDRTQKGVEFIETNFVNGDWSPRKHE